MSVYDKKVTDVGVVIFDVSSSGPEAIGRDDLPAGKMVLTFGDANVESCVLLDKSPAELNLQPVRNGNRFELSTDFFNKGETAKYQVVLSNYDERRDKIKAERRLKNGHVRLAEWDRPGRVDEWGKAFLSAFTILLGSFCVLFAISFQLVDTRSPLWHGTFALALAVVIAALHCWVATEAQREEAEARAFGSGPRSAIRQMWIPIHVYFRQFIVNKFYRRMLVIGFMFGVFPYALERLTVWVRQLLENLK